MIILFHPRATRPRNCRLPLAVLALAAVLEGREEYRIIDGNLEDDPTDAIVDTIDKHQVERGWKTGGHCCVQIHRGAGRKH